MQIIITVNTYFPLKDGVAMVTKYQAEGLAKLGHQVTVITGSQESLKKEEIYNNVKILRVNVHTIHALHRGEIKEYKKKIMQRTKKADVMINVCTQTALTDVLLPELDHITCKKILYMHGMNDFKWHIHNVNSFSSVFHKIWNNLRWGYLYKTSKKYFKKYDHIIQLHQYDQAYTYFKKRYGIDSHIIENAAEDVFFDTNTKSTLQVPKKYVICVANYIERKNQKMVLEAFYKADIQKEIELIFIGSEKTKYYNELIKLDEFLQQTYGQKRVVFLTNIARELVPEYVKGANLYAMGSTWEMFPISIVESMAAGIPFLTTDVGCARYLPGGVVVKNLSQMVYWMELLLKNEDTRIHLGMAGREYAKKQLSIEVKVKQLETILRS